MTYPYNSYINVSLKLLTREESFCGRYQFTQRPTNGQGTENQTGVLKPTWNIYTIPYPLKAQDPCRRGSGKNIRARDGR